MVSLRARFGDLANKVRMFIHGDTITVEVSQTKNSGRIKDRLGLFLVGTVKMASEAQWLRTWLEVRKSVGLTEEDHVFPVKETGGWAKEPAKLQDVNRKLKAIFLRIGADATNISTHSAKATLLHWAALFGLSVQCRARLGYHALASEGSVRSYSRDNLAEPLTKLRDLLQKVRQGTWNPDSLENFTTTIGFEKKGEMVEDEWKQGISPTAPFEMKEKENPEVEEGDTSRTEGEKEVTQELLSPTQMWGPEEEEEVSKESSDEEGDGEENSESDSELEEHVLETAAIIQESDTTLDMRRFLNVKSGKTHAGKPGSGSLAKCGKTLENLQRLAVGPDEGEEDVDYCKKCFRSAL